MEYDKWEPEKGLVIASPFQSALRKEGLKAAIAEFEASKKKNPQETVFYEGEILGVCKALVNDKKTETAAALLEFALKEYPKSPLLCAELGKAYRTLGKPAPMTSEEFIALLRAGEVKKTEEVYTMAKKKWGAWILFPEHEMNTAAYQMLSSTNESERPKALVAFMLNVQEYPNSFNAYDSLAECYMTLGKNELAITNYKKSLALNPLNKNAEEMIQKLQKQSSR